MFFHMTVVPTGMVRVAGLKAKLPLLSVVMVTVIVGPVMAVVAVGVVLPAPLPYPLPNPFVGGVDELDEALVVGVGADVAPVLVLLPQAANRMTAPSANR